MPRLILSRGTALNVQPKKYDYALGFANSRVTKEGGRDTSSVLFGFVFVF